MQKIQNFFRFFDAFGVPLTQRVQPKENFYKSAIGGITTLFIYILSILYASYIFSKWYTNQISPKMTTMLHQSDFGLLNLDYNIFQMYYYPSVRGNIDPFKENVLTLVVIQSSADGLNQTFTPILSDQISPVFNTTLLTFNNVINKFQNNGMTHNGQGLMFAIAECTDAIMPNGTQCADEEKINKFWRQFDNIIILAYQSFVLDSEGNPQPSLLTYNIRIEKQLTYQLNLNLLSNYYVMKDKLFTDNSREIEYLSGAQVQGQTNTMAYSNHQFGQLTFYVGFFVALYPNQTKVIIEYPHIGEILATIGSIIQVLFFAKYIINLINYDKLWNDLISQTMSFYYPHLSQIRYEYKSFNRIKAVYYKNKEIDKKQFLRFRQQLCNTIQIKLTFNNLIYEISRLYFLVRELTNNNLLRNSHNMGIRFEFSNDELGQISSRSSSLNDDLEMISLIRRQQNMDLINDEIIMQEISPNVTSVIS